VVQLEPRELGTLLVQVRLTNERLEASFHAASPEAQTLLHSQLPSLTDALNQQGFQGQHISVTLAPRHADDALTGQAFQQSAFQSSSRGGQQREGFRGRRGSQQTAGTRPYLEDHRRLVDVII
jgi:flagellar hook-length control protein FliK